jgi:hypothetical protein
MDGWLKSKAGRELISVDRELSLATREANASSIATTRS